MRLVISLTAMFAFLLSAAPAEGHKAGFHRSADHIKLYTDIPEVTPEEVSAIEAIKRERGILTCASLLDMESVEGDAGFSTEFFRFLSGFFGLEFVQRYHDGPDHLKAVFDRGEIDIAYGIPNTPGSLERYHVSSPVAGCRMNAFMRSDRSDIKDVGDVAGLRIGYMKGTPTCEVVSQYYPGLRFEAVAAASFEEAAEMIRTGWIDLFMSGMNLEPFFATYGFIRSHRFFSPVYFPVSVAVVKDEFAPIISLITKYLNAGGMAKISELYEAERTRYLKAKLYSTLTDDEREYIEELRAKKGGVVSVGFMHDAYPASYYNRVENMYQGIAPEILAEVSKLTGIKFAETVTNYNTPLAEVVQKLRNGEISIATHLLYSESRKNDFLWNEIPYLSSKYALLSRVTSPRIEKYQVYYHKIGLVSGSVHAEKFDQWFPNHEHKVIYPTGDEAFNALERGELCMVMLSESMLWVMTHYHGKSGYKVNIAFNDMQEALFGFNRDEEHLRSIVDKAIALIDVDFIRDNWMNRTFDYSKEILHQRIHNMYTIIATAVAALIVLIVMFRKNKKLGESLQHESSKFSTIFSALPDIAFYMDTNLRYVSVNEAFKRFAGKGDGEILGRTDEEVFKDKKQMTDYFTEMNNKALMERKTVLVHELVTQVDGASIYLETIKTPIFQNGVLMGVIGMARDITAHKAAQAEAAQASVEKSRFLANMSHEIRTPLNVIIGMTDLLSMEDLSSRQKNYVKDVSMASHSLLSIINDILDITKIEAGKLELSRIDYDFSEFVRNIASMFRFMAQKKGLGFDFEDLEDGLPVCLYGDDVKLKQVLINICANAVNYTGSGHVGFRVAMADDRLLFVVSDSGSGIKPDELENIFSPFMRGDSARTRNVMGTGLGLPISKRFIEMMGGAICVNSVYGKGSVFTVSIPIVKGDESKIVRLEMDGKSKITFKARKARILVVDDNNLNLKVAYRLLDLYGIAADLVPSGKEAIKAVQKADYDLVFMDHMMPEMDGIETTARIRELGGKYASLPIAALTANATRGVKEVFLSSGFDDYISKPIELEKLGEILKKWIPIDKIDGDVKDAGNGIAGAVHPKPSAFWDSVAALGFINVEVGKSRMAGIEEVYRETLDLFHGKALRECEDLERFLDADDMENFAILVHGMKSSLATIGAMGLSERALELETASKGGDRLLCRQKLPGLLGDLRELHKRMAGICGSDEAAPPPVGGRPKGDPGYLRENVRAALCAVEEYQGDTAAMVVSRLAGFDYGAETGEILKSAREALKNFDFEAAAECLKRLT